MRKILPYLLFVSISALLGFTYYTYTLFNIGDKPAATSYDKFATHNIDEIISSKELSDKEKLSELMNIKFSSKLLENRRKYLISRTAKAVDEDALAFIYSYKIDYDYLTNYSKKILIDHASYIGYEAVIVDVLKHILEFREDEPSFFYALAKSYARQNLKTQAQELFNKIQKKFPESEYALGSEFYLANLESDSKKRKERFSHYLKESPGGNLAPLILAQIKDNDEYKFLNNDIAMVYFNLEDYRNAIKYFDTSSETFEERHYAAYAKSLAMNKENLQSKNFLIEKIQETSDKKLASKLLNAVLTLGNSNADLYVLRSLLPNAPVIADEILWHIAERTKSKLDYQSVFQRYPKSLYAAESMSRVFWLEYKRKSFHLAKSLFEKHWKSYPETRSHPFVAFWMAKLYLHRKDTDNARSVLNNLISAHPLNYYSYRAKEILKHLKTNPKHIWFELMPKSKIVHVPDWERPELFSENDIKDLYGEDVKELFITKSYDYILSMDKLEENSFGKRFLTYIHSLANNNLKSIRFAHQVIKDSYDFKNEEEHQLYQFAYPLAYSGLVSANIGATSKLDPFIVHALMKQESTYQADIVSKVGAIGLMQLMPYTAKDIARVVNISNLRLEDIFEPEINIKLGVRYMEEVFRSFEGNMIFAIASYNAGPQRIKQWSKKYNFKKDPDLFVESIPYKETKNYVKKVLQNYWVYRDLYS
ncbi:MAG: transglycosylase SLT domain-containing protein [Candidatus Caenarcaniphilales bacterium]|nr:transglycosylase SLT domain-containing protein [Candidatus Caenarcaniphilales bacterium]